MIGRLKGTVIAVGADAVVIDVGGVGYEVYAAPRLLQDCSPGEAMIFAVETIVREDFIKLYGFTGETERQAFRMLQTVQGVGAKHALALLNCLRPEELFDAIAMEDATSLSRAQGVGKKLAQRIISELQSKIGAIPGPASRDSARRADQLGKAIEPEANARMDAVSALAHLGYDGVEARRAVARAAENDQEASVEDLIKGALKQLAA